MKKLYIAAPFTHPNPTVRALRVEMVNRKAGALMMQGYLVFSPLSHTTVIAPHCDVDPCDNEFWLRQDLWILDVCDEIHILCLDGWDTSEGVGIELKRAIELGLKVVYHGVSYVYRG